MNNIKDKRKKVFCEAGFLQEFQRNQPREEYDPDNYYEDCWKGLYRTLLHSDLAVNVSQKEYGQLCGNPEDKESYKQNPVLCKIWKSYTDHRIDMSFLADGFVGASAINAGKLDSSTLNALYLTTLEDIACQEKSEQFGIIVINNNSLRDNNCIQLFKDNITSVNPSQTQNWDFLQKYNKGFFKMSNCNSLIIVDSYLCSNVINRRTGQVKISYQKKLDYNLRPILDCFLPKKLAEGICFEIVIIIGEENANYSESLKYINQIINDLRPNLNVKINFYKDNIVFHDRTIATNNVLFRCGLGFDVFHKEGRARKQTTADIAYPFFINNYDDDGFKDTYNDFMKCVKQITSRYPEQGINCWGSEDHSNRMVSFYTEKEE